MFNAIYLETLTRKELVEKISSLFSINPSQITESFVQQKKSSFLVMLTDDVSKFCIINHCIVRVRFYWLKNENESWHRFQMVS